VVVENAAADTLQEKPLRRAGPVDGGLPSLHCQAFMV